MSQQASVTLNAVVYSPAGTLAGTSSWVSRGTTGLAGAFSWLKQTFKNPSTGTQTKIDFSLSVPVVATEDSACVCKGDVLRTNTVQVSVWVASTSTAAERTDLGLRIKDLVASSVFTDAVNDLNPAYG